MEDVLNPRCWHFCPMMKSSYLERHLTVSHSLIIAGIVVRSSVGRNNVLSRTSSSNVSGPLSRMSSSNGSVQSHGSARSTGSGHFAPRQATSTAKTVWVRTNSKDVMTAAVEGGWSTFIFTPESMDLAHEWTCRCFLTSALSVKICM